ncbi:NAD-dependent epimerase/dehydratase family protein [Streptomyces sp. NPDC059009]|uniref:NAD-dependent epimerase/dehydratase family protein n=1 Tax=Streptomyces sp. NPDC059009 TaxID=3346694 RepID=UPI0036C12918
MRIFVAGATGAIGRHLLPLLVQAGHDVLGATRSAHGLARPERGGARAVQPPTATGSRANPRSTRVRRRRGGPAIPRSGKRS